MNSLNYELWISTGQMTSAHTLARKHAHAHARAHTHTDRRNYIIAAEALAPAAHCRYIYIHTYIHTYVYRL